MEKPTFWKLPVHPGGEIYTVFDEESDFQVEKCQFLEPEGKNKAVAEYCPKIWFSQLLASGC